MLIRIVKLTFKPDNIPSSERIFNESKNRILACEGCHTVDLYRAIDHPNVFFTYSLWEKERDLQSYRTSDCFKEVWAHTNELFSDRAEAWSVNKVQPTNPS